LGPVFITWYVVRFGLEAMPYTLVLGACAFVFCLKFLPTPISENLSHLGFFGSIRESLGKVYKPILLIWLVMVLRSVTGQTFLTFMPIFLADRGHSLVSVGFIVSLFVVGGVVSGLLAGYLADRTEFKTIFLISHSCMAPALLLFLYLPGAFVYLGSFLAGFAVLASMPLGVAMAQRLAPRSRSMVSSLMMGFAYGLGGAFSPLIGKLGDMFGLENVLLYSAFVPIVTLVLIVKFPTNLKAQ
jgi:FSR family fosmidomycin resistance protein-like MFS transporter